MTYAITLVHTTQAFVRTNSELEILVSAVAKLMALYNCVGLIASVSGEGYFIQQIGQ